MNKKAEGRLFGESASLLFLVHPSKKLPRNAVCRHVFEPACAGGCRFSPSLRYCYPEGISG